MKKVFVIAVMMAMLSGAIYAQGITLSGYFNSGLGVVMMEDNAEEKINALKAVGVDSEQYGYRFRLNGAYQNDEKNAGIRLRLQSQSNSGSGIALAYAYGWMSFLENKINLTGGLIDDSTWQTADWWINDDVGEGLGALLKLTPAEGLNLGFGAYTISTNGSGSNNVLMNGNMRTGAVELYRAKYVISGSYTAKDAFRIGASFRTENRAANVNTGDDAAIAGARHQSSALIGELRYLGMKELTAVFAFNADNLHKYSDLGYMVFSETLAYKMDSGLAIGLNAVQQTYSDSDKELGLMFNLWGSYDMDSITPRIDLVYAIAGRSLIERGRSDTTTSGPANNNVTWHRRGFEITGTKDQSVISVRPSVKIDVDSRTHLEIGDMINLDSPNTSDSFFSNVFYIDLKWSF